MKKLCLFSFMVLLFLFGKGQGNPYGNEWITFSPAQTHSLQQYFKINIYIEGIYRITPNVLAAGLVPVVNNNFDHRRFQLFNKGVEQPIFVYDQNVNNIFDADDFIEFYATRNDGSFDSKLFVNPMNQANPNYSFFTDTACYYLTWNNQINNNRMLPYSINNYQDYAVSSHFIRDAYYEYTSTYYLGSTDSFQSSDPEFTEAEGWFDAAIYPGSPTIKNVPIHNLYTSGPPAQVTTIVAGESNHPAYIDHRLTIKVNSTTYVDTAYEGYVVNRYNFSVPSSSLGSGASISYTADGNNGSTVARNAVSWLSVKYPHTWSFGSETESFHKLIIPYDFGQTHVFANISNFNFSGNLFVYDRNSKLRIPVDLSAGLKRVLIPNALVPGEDNPCFLFSESAINYVTSVKAVTSNPAYFARFTNYNLPGMDFNYLIISHKNLWQEALNYRNYRNLTGHKVLLADIDELYDQFAFGIAKHPLSIRNFARYVLDKWSVKPQNVLLIGKSIAPQYIRIDGNNPSHPANISRAANYQATLVPTYGNPPSDILFTAGLTGSLYSPAIPIGRISARNPQEVSLYLDKIKAYETQTPADWMKQILHFGGGGSIGEQNQIRAYLDGYKTTIEGPDFAGKVTTVLKTSTEPIQINQTELLKARIDSGITLMTFFAHGNSTNFDISTDHPSTYKNKDRYPLVIANSCFAGDIHTPGRSTSEEFVLAENKGAIGFIAQVFLGFPVALNEYSSNLYKNISLYNYGKSIGRSMQATVDSIESPFTSIKTVCLEMTLHGDPALVLNSHDKPDIVVRQPDIFFEPIIISTEINFFDVSVVLSNIGKAVTDSFKVDLKRIFADGSDTIYTTFLSGLNYSDTIKFILPVDPFRGPGLNRFEVIADPDNRIDELDDLGNNFASTQMIIQSSDVTPVYPFEFAIVPRSKVTLKASTANAFDKTPRVYVFELDTTDSFNSPVLVRHLVVQSGGIVRSPELNLSFNLPYFWRVSLDSLSGSGYKWKESSFVCIDGKTGWSQAHFSQFKKDKFTNVIHNTAAGQFDFVTNVGALRVENMTNPFSPFPQYFINNSQQDYDACQPVPSMHIVVIDSVTLEPWGTRFIRPDTTFNPGNNFGNINDNGACRQRVEKYFIFRSNVNDSLQRNEMADMITQHVPDGNYVVAYSAYKGMFQSWNNYAYTAFESLGSTRIRTIQNTEPYIFFAKKGTPSSVIEIVGTPPDSFIVLNTIISGKWSNGFIESPRIGPATDWSSFHWEQHSLETVSQDSVYVDIVGIQKNGIETVLYNKIMPTQPDVYNLSASIPASVYPYIKLRSYVRDDVYRTPAQLDKWQVMFTPVPEAALNPALFFTFSKDTVHQGDVVSLSMAVENISDTGMDSLLVDFYVYDYLRQRKNIMSVRHRPLPAGDTIVANVSFSTKNLPDLNALWIEANPANDQPEQYHFNNFGEIKFLALRDITNPLLDVTFDGMHILDGEIVSARPRIVITLRDENKYLALEDTAAFAVYMKSPSGNIEKLYFEKIAGSSTNELLMKWTPAILPKNKFSVEYNPFFFLDGVYELSVQAKDMSDNLSGSLDYKISFEVINKSTITSVLNYPNPFSTSTRFVFTLTGSEVPTDLRIQIMTVTGKVVREIMGYELGPLRIGRNITSFAWDGTDQYSDKLANGVYLYRVHTRLNGSGIERRSTEADKYFKNGFGKMYIMR